jgi:hypothetical protein
MAGKHHKNRRSAACVALSAAALLAVAALTGTSAAAFDGARPEERSAIRVRVLQSDMMVAALSCGLRNEYNEAVRRFQAELVLNGRHLRAYFDRNYGARSQKQLDRFVTILANEASARTQRIGAEYCGSAAQMMAQILALPPDGLTEYSRGAVDLAQVEFAAAQ